MSKQRIILTKWFQCTPHGEPIIETYGDTKLESRRKCADTLYRGEKNPLKLMKQDGVTEKRFVIIEVRDSDGVVFMADVGLLDRIKSILK